MIGLTMGDANGIGPELILRAYGAGDLGQDILVIGDYSVLDYAGEKLGCSQPLSRINEPGDWRPGCLNVLDLGLLHPEELTIGRVSRQAGQAAKAYVERAAGLALAGSLAALVTLPVNKAAVRLADPGFTGHTELLAALCGGAETVMMLTSEKLTVTHVTTHMALAEAIETLTVERILRVIRLTHKTLAGFIPRPRLAVAGLNPHAGEEGAFGREEIEIIAPAMAQVKADGFEVEGPEPPDTVFWRASRGCFDAVICMYHDQGHIPMKLLDFEGGVNVTLGLPIIRTSVDHGTAYDIAYQGKSSTRSLVQAVAFARKMMECV